MNSGSFASSYVETVRLLDPTSHNFRTLSVRHPQNSLTKYPLFLRNTLTPVPRNNAARYSPWIHLSDGRGKEGSINRCGIGIVRWTLVEMVWRLMKWQPQYPPVRRLALGLVKSKRAKKRLAVQAARRLAIDLWRLSTGQTTPEKLGLVMHCSHPEN